MTNLVSKRMILNNFANLSEFETRLENEIYAESFMRFFPNLNAALQQNNGGKDNTHPGSCVNLSSVPKEDPDDVGLVGSSCQMERSFPSHCRLVWTCLDGGC